MLHFYTVACNCFQLQVVKITQKVAFDSNNIALILIISSNLIWNLFKSNFRLCIFRIVYSQHLHFLYIVEIKK